jgi:hypothetical protein
MSADQVPTEDATVVAIEANPDSGHPWGYRVAHG